MSGKRALVVEGGGMRGIFSAGVLDAFLHNKFDPFDIYIGVSAGACNLSSHLAGQYRRNFTIYTDHMLRPEFFSFKKFLLGGHYMDIDWLWDVLKIEYPLDVDSIIKKTNDKNFAVVCTDVDSGLPRYLEPDSQNMFHLLKASSAVPLLYRKFPQIGEFNLTDGGLSDPIPIMEAQNRGADRIVVIRSRPEGYVKKRGIEAKISSFFFKNRPNLKNTINSHADVYMQKVRTIENPSEGKNIMQIMPPETFLTGRTTTEFKTLRHDYNIGFEIGEKAVREIDDFIQNSAEGK